jgi:hypothetical protein
VGRLQQQLPDVEGEGYARRRWGYVRDRSGPLPIPVQVESDSLTGFENLNLTSYDDRGYGDGNNNEILCGAGADILSGNAGHDTLEGGTGSDKLSGGAGMDSLNNQDGQADQPLDCGGDALNSWSRDAIDPPAINCPIAGV